MRDIIRMTRGVYHCYMDSESNLYERPIGSIGKMNIDKRRDDFLKRYITLIINSKIVSDTTKIYIKDFMTSVASVIKSHNQTLPEGERINIKTAQSKVDYDTRKLLKYFPDNMLTQVMAYGKCDLEDYEKRLNLAMADYGKKNNMLGNLILRLPDRVEVQDNLEEDEFKRFMDMIAPYFKKNIKYLEDNLPEKAVGYIKFLLSSPLVTQSHKEHYELLKTMLV